MKNIYASLLVVLCLSAFNALAQPLNVYVSPTGASTGNGASIANPVSLARAQAIVKTASNQLVPCNIWLMDGVYTYLALDSTDTRTALAPVTYHSLNPLKAVFEPITPINPADLMPIPDSIKNRIVDSVAKTKVKQVSLASYNLSNMGVWPKTFGYPVTVTATTTTRRQWPILYQNTTPLPMSQYPNGDSVMRMKRVLTNGTSGVSPGGSFVYRDDRAKYWLQAIKDEGLWLRGSWRVAWQMDFIKTDSVNLVDSIIYQSIGVAGGIGDKYARPAGNGQEPYVAVNLLEEIYSPGDWCINFNTKMLYIYPPDSGTLNISSNSITQTIKLVGVSNTNLEGIKLDGGSSDGVMLNNCNHVRLSGMEITHVAGYGVFIANGTNCMVQSNDIHDVGEGGVYMINSNFAADQKLLAPCNHRVINNHIYNYAQDVFLYAAAIDTRSVIGSYCAYNKIHGCQHVGVLYGGNNNKFEFNDISDVVETYDDMGAFYMYQDQTQRGNELTNNYIHAMAHKGSGAYTDGGAACGQVFYNNILANCLYGSQNNYGYTDFFNSNIYYDNYKLQHTNSSYFLPDTNKNNLSNYTKLKNLYNSDTIYQNAYPDLKYLFPTLDSTYTSLIWPQLEGDVFIGSSVLGQCISNTPDKNLFNANGTTNNSYAKTNAPFKKDGLVCQNNLLVSTSLFDPSKNNLLDSLKSTGVFSKTSNTNWHTSRIGLFRDSIYRSNISQTQTAGVSPWFNLQIQSVHGFMSMDTLMLTVTIKNPNINHGYTKVLLYDSGIAQPSVPLTLVTASFDSVVFAAQWNNPSVGSHLVAVHLLDSTLWDFPSDSISFVIAESLPVKITKFTANGDGCNALLAWDVADEAEVVAYQVEQSNGDGSFVLIKTIAPKTTHPTASYQTTVPQQNSAAQYRIHVLTAANDFYSSVAEATTNCGEKGGLVLLPNPVAVNNNASLRYYHVGGNETSAISVYNTLGVRVWQQEIRINGGSNQYNIPTNHLPTGIYMVKLDYLGQVIKMEVR